MRKRGYVTDHYGTRHWVQGKDEIELAVNKALMAERLKRDVVVFDGSTTVRQWAKHWREAYRSGISAAQSKDEEMYLGRVILPQIGNFRLAEVRQIHLQKLFNSIAGKSASYNHKVWLILSQLFNSAVDNDLIQRSPMRGMKSPAGAGSGHGRALTDRERELFLKAAETARGGLFCLVIYHCGLRPGEVAALRWKDVDFEEGLISVTRAIKRDDAVGAPKSQSGVRVVPMPIQLRAKLKKPAGVRPDELIFTNSAGKPLTKDGRTRMWQSVKREMEIQGGATVFRNQITESVLAEDLTMYCLRHDYGTRLEAAGVSINVARVIMGHSSVEVTSRIYTHTEKDTVKKAGVLIDRVAGVVATMPLTAEK